MLLACINDDISNYPMLVIKCIETLLRIKQKDIYVVFDTDEEVFNEYKNYMNFSGQPGVGDIFFKWLHDNRWSFPDTERVKLHKTKKGYVEFPDKMEQINIDPNDMKFFALSYAHKITPVILEASDSKWWLWRGVAMECGIKIIFMDEQYMRDKNNDTEL